MVYTTIVHPTRKKLGLTIMEYMVCDIIARSQGNPKYADKGWCTLSYETVGGYIDMTKQGVLKAAQSLESKKLIKLNGRKKKVLSKWFNALEVGKQSLPNEKKEEKNGKQSLPSNGKQSLPKTTKNGKQSLPHKGSLNKEERKGKKNLPLFMQASDEIYQFITNEQNEGTLEAIKERTRWKGTNADLRDEIHRMYSHDNNSGDYLCKSHIANPQKSIAKLTKWLSDSKNFKRASTTAREVEFNPYAKMKITTTKRKAQ